MAGFSDYIVYVDETGDHSLTSINPSFPAFALSFCVFRKEDYAGQVVPAMQSFKFKYWGHDSVILHEHEIVKSKNQFSFLLTDRALREGFYADLNQMIADAPMTVIASAIDKAKLVARYPTPYSPYEIALKFCLERLLILMRASGQEGRRLHVIFECRGPREDAELELAFRRVVTGEDSWGWVTRDFSAIEFVPVFVKKAANSSGLQLADLTARPIALNMLRPTQQNRAFKIIQTKLGHLKHFP